MKSTANTAKTRSMRLDDDMWEYLRVRAFEERCTRSVYMKDLLKRDMEKDKMERENAKTAK